MIVTPVVVGIVPAHYASDVGLLASMAHASRLDPPQILSSGTGRSSASSSDVWNDAAPVLILLAGIQSIRRAV
jgi:hypothetical protein